MILHVFSPEFERKGIIRRTISTTWEESHADRGTFSSTCVDTEENSTLLNVGWYLYREEKKTAMVIAKIERDSEKNQIRINGYSTTELLNQRIIWPVITITNIEQGMYSIINNNRPIPNFTTAPLKGFTETQTTQFTGRSVLEAEKQLAGIHDWGFKTVFDRTSKKHVFTVYKGNDKTLKNGTSAPVVLSDRLGGIANIKITDDNSNFKNFAYVAGQGEGIDRISDTVGTATGLNRFELFVDARDIAQEEDMTMEDYKKLLRARGVAKLTEHVRQLSFTGEPITGPTASNIFDSTYFLGDKITCISRKYGIQIDARITKSVEIEERNSTKLKLTIGEPEKWRFLM